jgi:hypothetical protein
MNPRRIDKIKASGNNNIKIVLVLTSKLSLGYLICGKRTV